jgi:hypothetical protein
MQKKIPLDVNKKIPRDTKTKISLDIEKIMPPEVKEKMSLDSEKKMPSEVEKKMSLDSEKKMLPEVEKKVSLDKKKKLPLDVWTDILDVQVNPERLKQNLSSYTEILEEIKKLRALDLTDVHPAIIFEPTAPYRNLEKS